MTEELKAAIIEAIKNGQLGIMISQRDDYDFGSESVIAEASFHFGDHNAIEEGSITAVRYVEKI